MTRGAPVCAFGSAWPCGPCEHCRAESARLGARFAAEVTAGTYDAEGYTPQERRAWTRLGLVRQGALSWETPA